MKLFILFRTRFVLIWTKFAVGWGTGVSNQKPQDITQFTFARPRGPQNIGRNQLLPPARAHTNFLEESNFETQRVMLRFLTDILKYLVHFFNVLRFSPLCQKAAHKLLWNKTKCKKVPYLLQLYASNNQSSIIKYYFPSFLYGVMVSFRINILCLSVSSCVY